MTEHQIQKAFFDYVAAKRKQNPLYKCVFSVPSGAHLTAPQAGKLRSEGLTAGVPDVLCLVPARGFHGLAIEFKTEKGKLSKDQAVMIQRLNSLNYLAIVCRSVEDAIERLEFYLKQIDFPKLYDGSCKVN